MDANVWTVVTFSSNDCLSVIKCILYKVYTINAPFYRKCSCCISVLSR